MSELPILYSFVRCPYAMRARIALFESKINCILREVNLRDKPPHLIEISPKATVPILLFPDGKLIDESLDIVIYALDAQDEVRKEEISKLIQDNDREFVKYSTIYKYPDRYPDEDPVECRTIIEEKFLSKYDAMLEGNEYLFGSKTIADISLLPFVRQFAKIDEEWFFSSNYPNMIRWLKSFIETSLFKEQIMKKHLPWKEGDEITYLIS